MVNFLQKIGLGKSTQKRVWIHIGWHKTGSTSLQQALYQFRKDLEDKFSIRYVRAGQGKPAPPTHQTVPNHQPLGLEIMSGKSELLDKLIAEVRESDANDLVLSFEGFRHLTNEQLILLVKSLRDCKREVKTVAYARETVSLMESLYRQRMRRMQHLDGVEGFFRWFKEMSHGMFGYSATLELWSNAVGLRNMYVRDYDNVIASGSDTVADFFEMIGGEPVRDWIKNQEEAEGLERANPSLRNRFIEPMRKVGNYFAGGRDALKGREMNEFLKNVAIPLVESDPPKSSLDKPVFSNEQLARIIAEQEADYKVVEERWLVGEPKLKRYNRATPEPTSPEIEEEVWAEFCARVAGLKIKE